MNRDKLKSSFIRFMYAMADLLIVNLLWLLCSLPVVTVGPASCAMMAVLLKIARDEPVHTVKEFFSAFKSNFKPGLLLGLLALFAAAVIYADGIYAFSVEGSVKIVFCIVTGIVAAIWLTYVCYVFALQARFENTLRAHIRNAFLLAFCAPAKNGCDVDHPGAARFADTAAAPVCCGIYRLSIYPVWHISPRLLQQ